MPRAGLLGGAIVLVTLEFLTGLLDQPLFPVDFEPRDGVEILNAVAMVGSLIVALAVLGMAAQALGPALGRGEAAEDDPYGGHTGVGDGDTPAFSATSTRSHSSRRFAAPRHR